MLTITPQYINLPSSSQPPSLVICFYTVSVLSNTPTISYLYYIWYLSLPPTHCLFIYSIPYIYLQPPAPYYIYLPSVAICHSISLNTTHTPMHPLLFMYLYVHPSIYPFLPSFTSLPPQLCYEVPVRHAPFMSCVRAALSFQERFICTKKRQLTFFTNDVMMFTYESDFSFVKETSRTSDTDGIAVVLEVSLAQYTEENVNGRTV